MAIKVRIFIVPIILISLCVAECDKETIDDCHTAICTEEFRSIIFVIRHSSDNSPYVLSSYNVVRVSDNKDITPVWDSYSFNSGNYLVATDSNREAFRFDNIEVEFKGFLNDEEVIHRHFIITADCCHISLVEGETSAFL